jgi:hypothetical protein
VTKIPRTSETAPNSKRRSWITFQRKIDVKLHLVRKLGSRSRVITYVGKARNLVGRPSVSEVLHFKKFPQSQQISVQMFQNIWLMHKKSISPLAKITARLSYSVWSGAANYNYGLLMPIGWIKHDKRLCGWMAFTYFIDWIQGLLIRPFR